MSIEPAFGALFGWAVLKEHLVRIQFAAIALIILASIGTTWSASAQQHGPVPMPE
jgi:inner membrane transporter RhtA